MSTDWGKSTVNIQPERNRLLKQYHALENGPDLNPNEYLKQYLKMYIHKGLTFMSEIGRTGRNQTYFKNDLQL